MTTPRVLALSDLHIDYAANRAKFDAIEGNERDTLLLAGDLTSDLDILGDALSAVRPKFASVFFVPGNHELWLVGGAFADSMAKFRAILDLCASLDVQTSPAIAAATDQHDGVVVVPLFSWYLKPEEGADSLHVDKPGEDPSLSMWADERLVRWPTSQDATASDVFLRMNAENIARSYDRPVISLSHFLPRRELIFRSPEEKAAGPGLPDRHPEFNFSSVAGSWGLDRQVRQLGSALHVYGHQHRNRCREIDGVVYVSHCMGYPGEDGCGSGMEANWPKVVWEGARISAEPPRVPGFNP